ncbi:hypothetical protein ACNQFZ_09155 [Schinkia sp. CFF1]
MIRKLAQHHFQPGVTAEGSFDRYAEHMSILLKWFIHYDEKLPVYRLTYNSTTTKDEQAYRGSYNQQLRYIDAYSGKLIWEKKMSLL